MKLERDRIGCSRRTKPSETEGMMPPVDLNDVLLFINVVEAGSFTAAARELAMQKATVSRRVARLEQNLGTRLLNRNTRRIDLTELGRAYFEDVSQGFTAILAAQERLAAAQREPAGLLRIAAPVAFGTRDLMLWIAEFLETHDKVRIELKLTDETIDPITARIDLAFRTRRTPDSSLITQRVNVTRLILVASPAYLKRRGVPNRVEELGTHDCIIFGPSTDAETWHLEGPDGECDVPVSGRIVVSGSHAELQAALAGLGIALLPRALIATSLRRRELVHVLPRYGIDRGELTMVYVSNRYMPVLLRAFLDFVRIKAASLEG
jgi:DNA-binding transcriptional LysR family regulator